MLAPAASIPFVCTDEKRQPERTSSPQMTKWRLFERPLGPLAPRPFGPSAPRPLGPSAPRPLGPSALRPFGPSAPRTFGPSRLRALRYGGQAALRRLVAAEVDRNCQ